MKSIEELAHRIDGQIICDEAGLAEASTDFGRVYAQKPACVVRAASSRDVEETVKFAAANSLHIAARGAGHSQNGQSLTRGIQLDLGRLNRVIQVDAEHRTVRCQAGITWRDLLSSTLPLGLSPPVLTNNLDVTIGGTLSTAGLGVSSWRYGTQADRCLEMEVVTGKGERVRCSEESNASLFNAVRAGLGWFGVITEATLELRRHKPQCCTAYLLYDDLGTLFQDFEALLRDERFDYLESWCAPLAQGFRTAGGSRRPFAQWFFPLHCTFETDVEEGAGVEQKLAGLHFYKRVHEECETPAFFSRLDALFELWKSAGFWESAHPWVESLLPWKTAPLYIGRVLEKLPPQILAGGHILLWPARAKASSVPLFAKPPGELVMGFGILPAVPKHMLARVLPMLTEVSQGALAAGGKRYASGWLEYSEADWRDHFGAAWRFVEQAKRDYDPIGVFGDIGNE